MLKLAQRQPILIRKIYIGCWRPMLCVNVFFKGLCSSVAECHKIGLKIDSLSLLDSLSIYIGRISDNVIQILNFVSILLLKSVQKLVFHLPKRSWVTPICSNWPSGNLSSLEKYILVAGGQCFA